MSVRRELKFQSHILDSYVRAGGFGKKWATDLQKGPPDLIVSLPPFGLHLVEVKHEPELITKKDRVLNRMTVKQRQYARDYLAAGSRVYCGVVAASTHALGSKLALFHPLEDIFDAGTALWVPYVPGVGFDMRLLLNTIEHKQW